MKDSELVQLYNPYASTIRFEKFLKQNNLLTAKTKKIIDIGSGIGSNLQYFSKKNDKIKFTCSDYGQKRISLARKLNKNSNIEFIDTEANFIHLKILKKKNIPFTQKVLFQ